MYCEDRLFEQQRLDAPFSYSSNEIGWNFKYLFSRIIYSAEMQHGGQQLVNSVHLWQMMEQHASFCSWGRDQNFFPPLGKKVANYALAVCKALHWKPYTSICSLADNYYCLKPVEFRTTGACKQGRVLHLWGCLTGVLAHCWSELGGDVCVIQVQLMENYRLLMSEEVQL